MKKRLALLLLVSSLFLSSNIFAQIEKFQAAYMYNFFSYVEWPSDYRSGDFIIGVLGNDPIVNELNAIAKAKKVRAQSIKVQVFKSVDAITKCHVLFVPSSKGSKVSAAKAKVSGYSTLLISNTGSGISSGAAINFVLNGGKLGFEIKSSNAGRGVKISSALNQLATKVY